MDNSAMLLTVEKHEHSEQNIRASIHRFPTTTVSSCKWFTENCPLWKV